MFLDFSLKNQRMIFCVEEINQEKIKECTAVPTLIRLTSDVKGSLFKNAVGSHKFSFELIMMQGVPLFDGGNKIR